LPLKLINLHQKTIIYIYGDYEEAKRGGENTLSWHITPTLSHLLLPHTLPEKKKKKKWMKLRRLIESQRQNVISQLLVHYTRGVFYANNVQNSNSEQQQQQNKKQKRSEVFIHFSC
jgi:hypothetical protein